MRAAEFDQPSAAGCILYAEDTGRWCLQQRSDTVSDPGVWAAWGGGREPGESLEQTVRRELAEESGYRGPIKLEPLAKNARYATYIGIVPKEFEPRPCDEWKDYAWVELGHWPQPLHPGVAAALQNIYIKEDVVSPDYMTGHCHVMALALKKLHPDWQLRAHVGWDEEAEDDADYRIDHVYIVAPDGTAYDCRGRFDNEQQLVGPDETGGVETQFVDYTLDDIKADVARGELRPFSRADLANAEKFAQSIESVNENFADGQSKEIGFKTQQGKNKFATTMTVGNTPVGVYQYDANTGHSIAEIYPEYKGQGLGKLLVLNAIYTAAKLGMDFVEDESRTAEYDNVLDSLSSNGYIVDDDGYWYVTGEGEQFLKAALTQGVAENFADKKVKGKSRPGRVKRAGASCSGSVSSLRAKARKYGGERGRMYHWCANMKGGKKK